MSKFIMTDTGSLVNVDYIIQIVFQKMERKINGIPYASGKILASIYGDKSGDPIEIKSYSGDKSDYYAEKLIDFLNNAEGNNNVLILD